MMVKVVVVVMVVTNNNNEDNVDVQDVHSKFDTADDVMEAAAG